MAFFTTPRYLAVTACLGFLNFALHASVFELLLTSRLRWKFPALFGKPKWISNITGTCYVSSTSLTSSSMAVANPITRAGTPTVMDDVSVAAIGPFPELNDFNALSAAGQLPMVLQGTPPKCRYWSIQVFLKGGGETVKADTIVCDREFDLDENGEYVDPTAGSGRFLTHLPLTGTRSPWAPTSPPPGSGSTPARARWPSCTASAAS